MVFKNREEAAILLGAKIKELKLQNPFVLAIPRGGVVMAKIIAENLKAPLDVVVCRKLGVPGHEELGFAAIAPLNIIVFNNEIIKNLNISEETIAAVRRDEENELLRRVIAYRGRQGNPIVTDQDVIIIDDGIATGITVKAAIEYLKILKPATITLASPVSAADTAKELKESVDNLVLLSESNNFYAVGQFYQEFPQVSDEEVIMALKKPL